MNREWITALRTLRGEVVQMGGKGSGHWRHGGRKGKRGGSVPNKAKGVGRALSQKDVERAVKKYQAGETQEVSSSRNVSANVYEAEDVVIKAPKPGNEYVWIEYGGAQEIASDQLDFVPATRYYYSKETGPLIIQRKINVSRSQVLTQNSLDRIDQEAKAKGYAPRDLRWGNVLVDKGGKAWVIDIDMWDFPSEVLKKGYNLRRKRHAEAIDTWE